MKDLYVLAADTDAMAVLNAILNRPAELGIRPIEFHVDRNVGRDSGMVREGPELVRMKASKAEFGKVLLIWDNHGSGWEAKRTPDESRTQIQARLDGVTWQGHSGTVVLVPELEEWIWYDPDAVCQCLRLTPPESAQLVTTYADREGRTTEELKAEKPKELFEFVLLRAQRRKPLPSDFTRIAKCARLQLWRGSESFRHFVGMIQGWFSA